MKTPALIRIQQLKQLIANPPDRRMLKAYKLELRGLTKYISDAAADIKKIELLEAKLYNTRKNRS